MSKDKTREIIAGYIKKYSYIKLLDNPKRFIPCAMNIGIKKAKGDIIIRMDAHTLYIKSFISRSVAYLLKYKADNVGGIWITKPGADTLVARAIALSLSHPFGVGNSYFRIGTKKPRLADAVAFGCYWKRMFKKIGLFNEKMLRSEDIELNMRIKKTGGKIYLIPTIMGYYYAKPTLKSFLKHNFINGIWVTYPLKFGKKPFHLRHAIPLLFVLSLIISGILSVFFQVFLWIFLFIAIPYFLFNIYFSIKIAKREKKIGYFFVLSMSFMCLHIGYGFGSLWGLIKLIL